MECENRNSGTIGILKVLKIMKQRLIRKEYLIKKLTLIVLCIIHDFTKYKKCRNLVDLFYWPKGKCLDMAVIAMFIVIGLWSLWDDISIYVDSTEVVFAQGDEKILEDEYYDAIDDEEVEI